MINLYVSMLCIATNTVYNKCGNAWLAAQI